MKSVFLALVLVGVAAGAASAQPDNLAGGVLITHFPSVLIWSDYGYPEGWCQHYIDNWAIQSCDQQNPQIEVTNNGLWYVLAAWLEPKVFCGVEFGFGDYGNPFFIMSFGVCNPGNDALEIATEGWPGPNQGTALAAVSTPWAGNYVPVYYFEGYAYGNADIIPLSVDPPTGFAGMGNCQSPPVTYRAACLGGMGLMMPGIACCPEQPPAYVCCIGTECRLVFAEEECANMGGEFHDEWNTCDPNFCMPPPEFGACCVACDCLFVLETECAILEGIWQGDGTDCDPNPCGPSPVESTSWGTIKDLYR